MNAQARWKIFYGDFLRAIILGRNSEADDWRIDMWKIRREAALERRCAMLTRQAEVSRNRAALIIKMHDAWADAPLEFSTHPERAEAMAEAYVLKRELQDAQSDDPLDEWEKTHAFRGVMGNWRR